MWKSSHSDSVIQIIAEIDFLCLSAGKENCAPCLLTGSDVSELVPNEGHAHHCPSSVTAFPDWLPSPLKRLLLKITFAAPRSAPTCPPLRVAENSFSSIVIPSTPLGVKAYPACSTALPRILKLSPCACAFAGAASQITGQVRRGTLSPLIWSVLRKNAIRFFPHGYFSTCPNAEHSWHIRSGPLFECDRFII